MSAAAPRWDWYRLEPSWAERLVGAAGVRRGELIVDLGAGDGALTVPLAATGATVIAVELHAGRARRLRELVDAADGLDVRVVELDVADFRYPRRRVRVVANPPFSLASQLIRAAVAHPTVAALDLVLPRSVAERWIEQRRAARRFHGRLGDLVPRRAFRPPPRVDCVMLHLRRRGALHQPDRA